MDLGTLKFPLGPLKLGRSLGVEKASGQRVRSPCGARGLRGCGRRWVPPLGQPSLGCGTLFLLKQETKAREAWRRRSQWA